MKNCEEWSLEFDLLYNNIVSDKAPGLTEYEKSVFLTRAQEAVVVGLYKGTFGDAFESTEELTTYLGSLVNQVECKKVQSCATRIMSNSYIYKLPEDILFRTLELCKVSVDGCGSLDAIVVPVTQDEFWRTFRNPFKRQNKRRVLRLSYASSDAYDDSMEHQEYSELVCDSPIESYTVRYIKKPEPIILVDLEDGLSINGESEKKTCKLHEAIHQAILTEAVQLAKAIWNS